LGKERREEDRTRKEAKRTGKNESFNAHVALFAGKVNKMHVYYDRLLK